MKRLSFRFCRRAFLILAILFPIVYLCGGLFFALAGSHGNYDWHENTLVNRDYEEAMKTENFKYSDWDWDNEHGTRLGFSLGYIEIWQDADNFTLDLFSSTTGVQASSSTNTLVNHGLGYRGDNPNYMSLYCSEIFADWDTDEYPSFDIYTCCYMYDGTYLSAMFLSRINSTTSIHFYRWNGSTWLVMPSSEGMGHYFPNDLVYFYFDDGSNLPEGVEWNDELRSYFVPTLKPIESNSLSDYIFSQPFVNDNFIASLGRGVLDDTAFGFPPFRDMFNWFNDSVMHIESDDALGVFGLGYAYYALNVVAVYELVVLVMMVFLLPLRITDKFMGDNL